MRTAQPLVTAAVFAAALMSGCNGSVAPSARPAVSTDNQMALLRSAMSPARLLQLQAEGRLPGPVPAAVSRLQLRNLDEHWREAPPRSGGTVALWASDTNFNYLLGQNAGGGKTVVAVDLSQHSCLSPVALKVDHARNVWVGCELTSPSSTAGAVQVYDAAGVFQKQFLPACPGNVSHCQSFEGFGYDSAIDPQGNAFASLNLYAIETCNPSCTNALGAGFEWWPKEKSSAKPRLISVGDNCSPICGVGFADTDANGNLWFTFSGYDQSSTFGFGLGEITSPTKNPKVTIIEPIGSYQFFGGVYASDAGKTLNVVDQAARTISQYHVPVSPSAKPFNVLGPTLLNAFKIGDPVSGGFNQHDTKMALGDTGGWLDIGTVAANTWSAVANPNFYSGIEGAAYVPSDK